MIAGDFIDANRIVFSTQTCLHLATRQLDQSWQTRSAALSCGPIGEGLQPRIARLPQGAYMVLSDQNVRVVPLDLKDPNLGLPRSLTSSDWINLAAAPTALAVDQAQIFRYQQAVYLLSHVRGVWGLTRANDLTQPFRNKSGAPALDGAHTWLELDVSADSFEAAPDGFRYRQAGQWRTHAWQWPYGWPIFKTD